MIVSSYFVKLGKSLLHDHNYIIHWSYFWSKNYHICKNPVPLSVLYPWSYIHDSFYLQTKMTAGWTPKLTQQHMKRTYQHWEACQTIQNTPLCPQFRHNFLQCNLYLQSNIANNRATKQIRSKQQNQQTWTMTTDWCYIPFEEKWVEGNIPVYILSKNLHQFLYASQFFTLNYWMQKKIYTKAYVSH